MLTCLVVLLVGCSVASTPLPPRGYLPLITQTLSPAAARTSTPTPTQAATPTGTFTATATASREPTATETQIPTDTPLPAPTATTTQTATPTATRTATATSTSSLTPAPTATKTATTAPTATRTATVAPTAAPTVAPPAGANVVCRNVGAAQLCAWVSNGTPAQNATVTAYGRLLMGGVGVNGARMVATWHYKSTTSTCEGTTGSGGVGSCARDIGRATKGFRVDVVVQINGYAATTFFVPQ